jgi:hypothetical protein
MTGLSIRVGNFGSRPSWRTNARSTAAVTSAVLKAAANVIRNVDHKPRRFSTWAPKAIATIRTLADTIEDRAVVVRLQDLAMASGVEPGDIRDGGAGVRLKKVRRG